MNTEKKLTYTESFEELQAIVKKMENADVSVDDLLDQIKRASELIKICKEKLTSTEKEVENIIQKEV
ncbi:MAG: exodeoxyribonuclease VII small subunit [Bacteroidales bacterium]|jgi:exodeoxyribonuclease VII small subunit|nr:exodeoxyribonuclease VII small subunit [Bacteroidales bacterium]